jgi:hypothetical protein
MTSDGRGCVSIEVAAQQGLWAGRRVSRVFVHKRDHKSEGGQGSRIDERGARCSSA